jgi:hypothetical protein
MGCGPSKRAVGFEDVPITMTLRKEEAVSLGFSLKTYETHPYISAIEPSGSCADWNRMNPLQKVEAGDFVISVNGVSGDLWQITPELCKLGDIVIIVQKNPSHVKQSLLMRPPGTELSSIDSFPQKRACEVDDMMQDECVICFEDFQPEDLVAIISCGHVFHRECAVQWLAQPRQRCPLCRRDLVRSTTP